MAQKSTAHACARPAAGGRAMRHPGTEFTRRASRSGTGPSASWPPPRETTVPLIPCLLSLAVLPGHGAAQHGDAPAIDTGWTALTLAFLAGALLVHLLAWRSVRAHTQRRDAAERELQRVRRSEQHLRQLLEGHDDLVWEIDEQGVLRYQSSGTLALFGFPASEFTGRPYEEFLTAITQPPDRERLLASARLMLREHEAYSGLRFQAHHRGGQLRAIESSAAPVFDGHGVFHGYRGLDRDISERVATEAALRESEQRYRTLAENAYEAIVLLDCDTGRFVDCNRSACEMFGLSRKELLGIGPVELTPAGTPALPDPPAAVRMRIEQALRDRRVDFEWIHRDRDGRVFPCEVRLVHVPDQRRRLVRGSILDISERRAAERMQALQRDQLAQAEKVLALGTLVGGLAHEINNPTHSILLNLPLLRHCWRDAEPILAARAAQTPALRLGNLPFAEVQRELPALLDEIEFGTTRIANLIGQLRSYARDSGPGSTGPVGLNRVVELAVSMLGATLRYATGNLRIQLAEELPAVHGTARRLEQAVLNLLLNACQSLTDPTQEIRVLTRIDPGAREVVVEVRDQGRGIPPADLPHVMDPFFTSRRELGAVGLGLSIVARIAEDHHGRLELESTVGSGTTARLHLPATAEGSP